MAKRQIESFRDIGEPDLTRLVDLCAKSLYFELGGVGPALPSTGGLAAAAGPPLPAGNVPLLPNGNQSPNTYKSVAGGRPGFPASLKGDLLKEQKAMFRKVFSKVGAVDAPSSPKALVTFLRSLEKLMCPGCLESREPQLMERDHLDAWTFIRGRLNTFLGFLNESDNEKFADKLIAHPDLKGVFVKDAEGFKITGSGLARAYSANFNMWLLCRLCNGGANKSAEEIKAWFDGNTFFKGFTGSLAAQGLSIERGLLLKGLFGPSSSDDLILGSVAIPLRGTSPISLRQKALEWICTNHALLVQSLSMIHELDSRLSADAREMAGIKEPKKRERTQEAQQDLVSAVGEVYAAAADQGALAMEIAASFLARKRSAAKRKQTTYTGLFKTIETTLSASCKDKLVSILGAKRIEQLSASSWRKLSGKVDQAITSSGADKGALMTRLEGIFNDYAIKIDAEITKQDGDDSVSVSSASPHGSDGDDDRAEDDMTPGV